MSEIKLNYQQVDMQIRLMKMRSLSFGLETTEPSISSKSDTMQAFVDTYTQLKELTRLYRYFLCSDLERINEAVKALVDVDEIAAINVETLGKYIP